MSEEREKKLWYEFKIFNILLVLLALILIVVFYFVIGFWTPSNQFWQQARDLILNVIENTVPVFLAIIVSFILYRRVQQLQNEAEREELAESIASRVKREIREELRITLEDSASESAARTPDFDREIIKELETPSKITKTKKNHRLIDSSFISWNRATIMLWVRVPPKNQALRKAPDYKYLLAHRTVSIDTHRSPNLFCLRYRPDYRWELRFNNSEGKRKEVIIDDSIDVGWHHFMIAWNKEDSTDKLIFRIDKGDGGQRRITHFFAEWPEKLSENLTVGAWYNGSNMPPYDESYCETELFQLWICNDYLELSDPIIAKHYNSLKQSS